MVAPDEPHISPAQERIADHPEGPLVVLGGAGTGKTTALVERVARLADRGTAPDAVVLLTSTVAGADDLRERLEARLTCAYEELAVHTVGSLCVRLLHDQALDAGLEPFVVPVSAADRLAMLLERVDDLTLREHDLGGHPAALLSGVVARIDRLKEALVTAEDYAAWAAGLSEEPDALARTAREREFAQLYLAHDRMLAERGAIDEGDLLLRAIGLLRDRAHVREGLGGRYRHLLVDELQDLGPGAVQLIGLLAAGNAERPNLVVCADDDQCTFRLRNAAAKNVADVRRAHPEAPVVRLEQSFRCSQRILDAAGAVLAHAPDRIEKTIAGPPGGSVQVWRAANERAQAQNAASEIERLVREGTSPREIAVVVRNVRNEGPAVANALAERAVPHRVVGAATFFQRAEVRDLLAWLRLLNDPHDAGAVVRALSRPPIELRAADMARVIQIARRRKLDMVGALAASTESPQIPPESRERILAFLKLHRSAGGAFDTTRPDLFIHRLVDRLGLRRQQLFAAQADVVERLRNLARFADLAGAHVRRDPQATTRDFARYIAAVAEAGLPEEEATADSLPDAVRVVGMRQAKTIEADHVFVLGLHGARMPGARRPQYEPIPDALLREDVPDDTRANHVGEMRRLLGLVMTRARKSLVLAYPERSERGAAQPPSPFLEEAREALDLVEEPRAEELFGPEETLHATFQALRDTLLHDAAKVGKGLGELRLETDLDVTHAVVRYLELVKVAALMERPTGQTVSEALPLINQRLGADVSPLQREILESSDLDGLLLDAEREDRARAAARAVRAEPSLEPFLPRRGEGLALSASDIEAYRMCPLKYKFARVFRIPQEPTVNQRFGIIVHQVLERYHGTGSSSLDDLLGLLEAGWRRGGMDDGEQAKQLRGKAEAALRRYWERQRDEGVDPVWIEKSFSFQMGPHTLRGRVDRVDRLPDGTHELIDYKTGRPRSAHQLREDVQLSLYAIGAREAWHLDSSEQAYLYVLDDEKVRVPSEEMDPTWIRDTIFEVAEGILGQGFEPTPSFAACSMCDYRIACPAAER
ncbi:MAG: ATP-dependent helicase [Solirubrobacteraceae bacterium]|nr:ATP-dependent helicase [Solirubrobacteraceae bacterium]